MLMPMENCRDADLLRTPEQFHCIKSDRYLSRRRNHLTFVHWEYVMMENNDLCSIVRALLF